MFRIFRSIFKEKGMVGPPGFRSEYVFEIYNRVVRKYGKFGAVSIVARKLKRDRSTIYHHIEKFGFKTRKYSKKRVDRAE